jgi:hypothetical protein
MNRIEYFINKLWTLITSIHPLSYLMLFVVLSLFYLIFRELLVKYRPVTKSKNAVSFALTLTIGLPIIALTIYFIGWLILKDQLF